MRVDARRVATWGARGGAAVALVALVLSMAGVFSSGRIAPARLEPPRDLEPPRATAVATRLRVPVWYEAVGTVRSAVEARVGSQIAARILAVLVDEGRSVAAGDLLATLDARELESRMEQARGALDAAEAARQRADSEHARVARLFEREAATKEQLEAAEAVKKQAVAQVESASQRLEESRVALGYARIFAPIDGVIQRREADPGDLAWPGRTLLTIHDPRRLRLEASVREGLVGLVRRAQAVTVLVTSLGEPLEGTVEEVVPSVDPVSRSFIVKVGVPFRDGLYPGMFGKLRLETGQREAVAVPRAAIRSVGQLDTVVVRAGDRWTRRYVTVGKTLEAGVEVLSGLSGGETVGVEERADGAGR